MSLPPGGGGGGLKLKLKFKSNQQPPGNNSNNAQGNPGGVPVAPFSSAWSHPPSAASAPAPAPAAPQTQPRAPSGATAVLLGAQKRKREEEQQRALLAHQSQVPLAGTTPTTSGLPPPKRTHHEPSVPTPGGGGLAGGGGAPKPKLKIKVGGGGGAPSAPPAGPAPSSWAPAPASPAAQGNQGGGGFVLGPGSGGGAAALLRNAQQRSAQQQPLSRPTGHVLDPQLAGGLGGAGGGFYPGLEAQNAEAKRPPVQNGDKEAKREREKALRAEQRAQKAAAASAAKAQEKERERQAKLAAQQDRAQQQRMGDVMKNVFGTSGANKPKIKIKVSNPGAAGGRPPPAATRSGAAKGGGGGGGMGAPMPQQDAWLDDALGAQGMPFGDSDEDLDLGDLNSDDSLYMPSPQHPTQPGASKGQPKTAKGAKSSSSKAKGGFRVTIGGAKGMVKGAAGPGAPGGAYPAQATFKRPEVYHAPNYSKVIAKPMCFDMVRDRLTSGQYDHSYDEFRKELLLIFENAMAYNPPENFVHQTAKCLHMVASKYLDLGSKGVTNFRALTSHVPAAFWGGLAGGATPEGMEFSVGCPSHTHTHTRALPYNSMQVATHTHRAESKGGTVQGFLGSALPRDMYARSLARFVSRCSSSVREAVLKKHLEPLMRGEPPPPLPAPAPAPNTTAAPLPNSLAALAPAFSAGPPAGLPGLFGGGALPFTSQPPNSLPFPNQGPGTAFNFPQQLPGGLPFPNQLPGSLPFSQPPFSIPGLPGGAPWGLLGGQGMGQLPGLGPTNLPPHGSGAMSMPLQAVPSLRLS
ncbi:hypothetical protein DUNSADRAFT_9562 [Dunaliella salina]|uniref:Bromo domain-containing protein n=1 Tax=Dunaliella salina TaxID=3046 RepID=A0ABQ7GH66_DUNSA|nr:hypothetical protein DUNSADRAFT_9562 [Dunaliella salina]|eukprot:KAF5833950.1 hypothetical protein DUNSADRAFT_9562 [Dunaliella salina]